MKTLLTLLSAVVVAVAVVAIAPARAESGAKASAPEWTLQDVDGQEVKSSDFAGKVVVVDFWATWCPPCREEIPGYVALQEKYRDQGVVILGISLDRGGPKVVKPFAEKMKINYPLVMGTQEVVEAFGGVEGIPTTFIIDREGKIRHKKVGYASEEKMEALIKSAL
ncbi:MAG: TlpA disulfide reductase family protein [Verrucomicrobiota bacterium]